MPTTGRRRADTVLVMALANGATVEAAAKKAGVSERTVYRRLKELEFRKRLFDLQVEMVRRSVSIVSATTAEAAHTLNRLLREDIPPYIRFKAAAEVFKTGQKMRAETSLQARMNEIEQNQRPEGRGQRPTRPASENDPPQESRERERPECAHPESATGADRETQGQTMSASPAPEPGVAPMSDVQPASAGAGGLETGPTPKPAPQPYKPKLVTLSQLISNWARAHRHLFPWYFFPVILVLLLANGCVPVRVEGVRGAAHAHRSAALRDGRATPREGRATQTKELGKTWEKDCHGLTPTARSQPPIARPSG